MQQFMPMEVPEVVAEEHMLTEVAGGGYPAAGIGGGGAGGAGGYDPIGGGGFTGGNSECNNYSYVRCDGLSGYAPIWAPPSGGYFSKNYDSYSNPSYEVGKIGGGGSTNAGNGGKAGSGGNVSLLNSNVFAYNGSYITSSNSGTDTNPWGKYQCPIYLQLGISLDKIRNDSSKVNIESRNGTDMLNELQAYTDKNIKKNKYKNTNPIVNENEMLGIGSGAGYIEVSNGSLKIFGEEEDTDSGSEENGIESNLVYQVDLSDINNHYIMITKLQREVEVILFQIMS